MFSTVSNWLVGSVEVSSDEDNSSENKENKSQSEKAGACAPKQSENKDNVDKDDAKTEKAEKSGEDSLHQLEQVLDDVSAKAINTAKEWGSYLYSFGKKATLTMAETAKQIKNTVEEQTILGDFTKEQSKFVTEKKDKQKLEEAAVPPWVGYTEEDTMKTQIMALSQDKRNFCRNPPAGVKFHFDFEAMFPVAMATLQEDEALQKMRFDLVPKQINEESFWRNYFYRVSLIKQSTQLTSLAQQTGSTGENRSSGSSRRSSSGSEQKGSGSSADMDNLTDSFQSDKERSSPQTIHSSKKDDDLPPESPPHDNEFVSDAFADNQLDEESLRKEMQQLGVEDTEKEASNEDIEDLPQWEQELQKELQEYEMVDDGGDPDLESEILQQIEEETKSV